MNPVLKALQFRHACKVFDANRKIPADDLESILECARISPSSFGMEPWRFVVVQDAKLRQNLRKACWDQPQITDSSDVVVILSQPALIDPDNQYVEEMFFRRGLPEDATRAYIKRYKDHFAQEVDPYMSRYGWTSKQCYIALANMMSAAAAVGIDSCPIEGFDKTAVEQALALDPQQYEAAVVLTLGYRAGEQSKQLRRKFNDVVEFR